MVFLAPREQQVAVAVVQAGVELGEQGPVVVVGEAPAGAVVGQEAVVAAVAGRIQSG